MVRRRLNFIFDGLYLCLFLLIAVCICVFIFVVFSHRFRMQWNISAYKILDAINRTRNDVCVTHCNRHYDDLFSAFVNDATIDSKIQFSRRRYLLFADLISDETMKGTETSFVSFDSTVFERHKVHCTCHKFMSSGNQPRSSDNVKCWKIFSLFSLPAAICICLSLWVLFRSIRKC